MNIQSRIVELEESTAQTAHRLSAFKSQRCLVLLNDINKAQHAINWLKSRLRSVNQLVLVIKAPQGINSPIAIEISNPAAKSLLPAELIATIADAFPQTQTQTATSVLHCIPSLELTTTVVSFIREKSIEAVIVAGCHCLSRKDYENVQDFKPLIEEIILKEAIQPVILIK